jgi:hypothetical protein
MHTFDQGGELRMDDEIINMQEWYTVQQALERLRANSGKNLDESYPRRLARDNKVKTRVLGPRSVLYWKTDIDSYIVENRGMKVARVQRQRAAERRQKEHGNAKEPGRISKDRVE